MSATTIAAIRATPVTVPLEAPLLHSNGAHWGRFVRTIVEVETADGYVGLGEMGGGGEDATRAFAALADYLRGHDVFRAGGDALRDLQSDREPVQQPHAAARGDRVRVPRHHGPEARRARARAARRQAARRASSSRATCSSATPIPRPGAARCARPSSSSPTRARSRRSTAFTSHKLKGGVYPPAHELACYRALAAALPGERFRYDPNSALSLADAIDFGHGIDDLRNDYFEDPVWGMPQLARLKEFVPLPDRDQHRRRQFRAARRQRRSRARSTSILLDTTFWGGIRPCIKAAGVCETMGLGVAVHSSGELGIQLATMLHLGAVCRTWATRPTRTTITSTDDVIAGGQMRYANGAIRVPDGTGLGVTLDREKLAQYHELYRELGGYPYDRDPGRPGWYPHVPNHDWADPDASLRPELR